LPHRSASALLVDVQRARLDGLSGTIVQNADLGLPSLPGVGGSGSSDLASMVAGSHTLRLWYAGPDHVRLALLGSLGESDVVRNGTDLWTWSSAKRSADHRSLPRSSGSTLGDLASSSPVTPQQAAETALRAVSPSTRVSTDGTAVVAGRSAYELLLEPRDPGSLVSSVRIAIDGSTHIPTRVQVFAQDAAKPSFEVGFTAFDPTPPQASVFRFNPPPGTRTTEASSPSPSAAKGMHRRGAATETTGKEPEVTGSGWTAVVVAQVPGGTLPKSATLTQALKVLPEVSGSWGSGHLLRGTLFSALLTDDGRIAVGAVAPERLFPALAHR
jgi:outer membrane lipoprotein-sorting protein